MTGQQHTESLLVINAGSSSVKYRVFDWDSLSPLDGDKIERIGESGSLCQTHRQAFEQLLEDTKKFNIKAAAHRVVHGGDFYDTPVLVTDEVMDDLRSLSVFAPLHQPHNLDAISVLRSLAPDMPQYADFDTAFHAGHDPVMDAYALPKDLRQRGLRKFGFHGLSYQSICSKLRGERPDLYSNKTVIAHLGNGASLCAVKNGRSIDTTMGLTALEGLPMGTRSGSVDPGLVLYLGMAMGKSFEELAKILYHKSGLLGLSNLSNDMKTLEENAEHNSDAKFAIDVFVHKTSQHICQMMATLGGMDALVFTGGIGENSALVRQAVTQQLSFLPHFEVLVIPTNEELSIAENVRKLILSI